MFEKMEPMCLSAGTIVLALQAAKDKTHREQRLAGC